MTDSNLVSAETIERAKKRVKKMGDTALLDWADVAVPGIQRHLDAYRSTADEAHLVEASMAQWQLQLVLDEVMERHLARKEEGLTS